LGIPVWTSLPCLDSKAEVLSIFSLERISVRITSENNSVFSAIRGGDSPESGPRSPTPRPASTAPALRKRLTFLEPEGKVGYRWGREGTERETMNYLEFIVRMTSHIPDWGQVMSVTMAYIPSTLRMAEEEPKLAPSKGWTAMIRKVTEIDRMVCPRCCNRGERGTILIFRDHGE
jgi:hypothetical protein